MASQTMSESRSGRAKKIPIRTITDEDLRLSLRQGWEDFGDLRGDIFFAGLIYTVIGLAAVVMTTSAPLIPFFFPVVAGVALLGPIAAIGFYELARQRENGRDVHWYNFLDFRKLPSLDDMGIVAGLLLLIFVGWLLAAGLLYAVIFGWATPTSVGAFLSMIFTSARGWTLIIAGAVAGAFFGWFVLALSVVSLPMLVDCDISAAEAVSASWRATNANKGEMVRWGILVTALLVLGSIPAFVGLAFVLPWLGYSTWHLYTRLIERGAVPARLRRPD
ncbi:MAG TPA: DUF2189 domain-containing protein [Sphingomicrobium sp.]|jgi:uncharacterized membrane protein|nr:DUF2189 domain-containing protein [Sphingomicrobium sp.]